MLINKKLYNFSTPNGNVIELSSINYIIELSDKVSIFVSINVGNRYFKFWFHSVYTELSDFVLFILKYLWYNYILIFNYISSVNGFFFWIFMIEGHVFEFPFLIIYSWLVQKKKKLTLDVTINLRWLEICFSYQF